MPGYWVARSRVIEPASYKLYTDRVPEILDQYGARPLSRGARYQIVEGPERFNRFVVIEFPTFEAAQACFQSPEYRAAAEHRRNGAGEAEIVLLEPGDLTPT